MKSHADNPFDFAGLRDQARDLAARDYVPSDPIPQNLASLDYDQYRKILFNTRNEIWKKLPFALQFMHLGYFDRDRVVIHEIDGGEIREIPFSKKYYLYTGTLPADAVDEKSLNFAGFRILFERKPMDYGEIISFLGASYFRAVAAGESFGLSARGLAINTIPPGAEEFPAFRQYWIERPKPGAKQVIIYALLDSASATGAYEFTVTPTEGKTLVHIKTTVFARKKIEALGIAPLTSMFWYSAINAPKPISKGRPAVHDSDGLLVHTGSNIWLWHPFSNPPQLQQNFFMDENVRGFGLLQRDRDPGDYKDNEANYFRRPNAWVEPVGNWGKGSVRLLEIHSNDEYTDNVVALWTPADPLEAGKSLDFEYNMTWSALDPSPAGGLHVASTTVVDSKAKNRRKFIIHFSSDERIPMAKGDIKADVDNPGNADITTPVLSKTKNGWNVALEAAITSRPAELDCVLEKGKKIISEKWHFNLQP